MVAVSDDWYEWDGEVNDPCQEEIDTLSLIESCQEQALYSNRWKICVKPPSQNS